MNFYNCHIEKLYENPSSRYVTIAKAIRYNQHYLSGFILKHFQKLQLVSQVQISRHGFLESTIIFVEKIVQVTKITLKYLMIKLDATTQMDLFHVNPTRGTFPKGNKNVYEI